MPMTSQQKLPEELQPESFDELIKYTGAGIVGGLAVGAMLDWLGFQRNPFGQWIVRTLAGEGESIFEGVFAVRRRIAGAAGSMAEAYGWGKLLGMVVPWIVDLVSRLLGLDVNATRVLHPYFYAMSDQIGAKCFGLRLPSTTRRLVACSRAGIAPPVMVASLLVVLLVPFGLLSVRLFGFSPTTQLFTAIETIGANLCWVPPLVGWFADRRRAKRS